MRKSLLAVLLASCLLTGCAINTTDYTVEQYTSDGNPAYHITFDKGTTIEEAKYYIETGRFADDNNVTSPDYSICFEIENVEGIGVTYFKNYKFNYWMGTLD